jgi:hypothetical protein
VLWRSSRVVGGDVASRKGVNRSGGHCRKVWFMASCPVLMLCLCLLERPKAFSPSHDMLNDSPHPHCSVIFGFLNTNLVLSLSSNQSISLPIMLNNALLSISTFTPSCSTTSSNVPAFSTYSRWYASPEQPLFLTPTRIIFGSGCSSSSRRWRRADGVIDIAALRALSLLRRGFFSGVREEVCGTGVDFCAARSGTTMLAVSVLGGC